MEVKGLRRWRRLKLPHTPVPNGWPKLPLPPPVAEVSVVAKPRSFEASRDPNTLPTTQINSFQP